MPFGGCGCHAKDLDAPSAQHRVLTLLLLHRAVFARRRQTSGFCSSTPGYASCRPPCRHLSPATVPNYLSNAIAKVCGRDRLDAIRIARDAGWLWQFVRVVTFTQRLTEEACLRRVRRARRPGPVQASDVCAGRP